MTQSEARRACEALHATGWPDGVECEAFPIRDDDGDGFAVVVNFTAHGKTRDWTIHRPPGHAVVKQLRRIATTLSESGGGSGPPVAVAVAGDDDGPGPMPDWLRSARLRITACGPMASIFPAIEFASSVERDDIECPDVTTHGDTLTLAWRRDGKNLAVTFGPDAFTLMAWDTVLNQQWANDHHAWPSLRAVNSARNYLRWLYPAESSAAKAAA